MRRRKKRPSYEMSWNFFVHIFCQFAFNETTNKLKENKFLILACATWEIWNKFLRELIAEILIFMRVSTVNWGLIQTISLKLTKFLTSLSSINIYSLFPLQRDIGRFSKIPRSSHHKAHRLTLWAYQKMTDFKKSFPLKKSEFPSTIFYFG